MDRLKAGGVDLWSIAKPDGVTIGPNIVDDKNTGRNDNTAEMHRRIVAAKEKIVIKFAPLSQANMSKVAALVYQTFVNVNYYSPRYGQRTGVPFYAQINTPTLSNPMWIKGRNENVVWKEAELTLVEK